MDPWPETVFRMADGQHTVGQLQAFMAGQYKAGAPTRLDEQVVSVVRQLESERLVRLHATSVALPFYLATPISEQDAQKARAAMQRDGFGGQSSR